MKKAVLLTVLYLFPFILFAQTDRAGELFRVLKCNDSLLFNLGFNNCDLSQFEKLVSDNFEFYHDQAGITSTKAAFILGVKNGLCKLPYKPVRELEENSLEVFPLENEGVLYGAIQMGRHSFYAIEKDGSRRLTSTAKFTHLWLIENGVWKLSRGLSYDHRPGQ